MKKAYLCCYYKKHWREVVHYNIKRNELSLVEDYYSNGNILRVINIRNCEIYNLKFKMKKLNIKEK